MSDPNTPANPVEPEGAAGPEPTNGAPSQPVPPGSGFPQAAPPEANPSTPSTPPVPSVPSATPAPPAPPVPPVAPGHGAAQQPYGQQPQQTFGQQPPAPAYDQRAYGQPAPGYAQPYAPSTTASPILSILSLVGGIIGVILNFAWGIGFLFAVAAIILGFIGRRREPQAKGFWLTGIILGFVAVVIAIIFWIVAAIFFANLSPMYNRY